MDTREGSHPTLPHRARRSARLARLATVVLAIASLASACKSNEERAPIAGSSAVKTAESPSAASSVGKPRGPARAGRPNIIVVLTDDLDSVTLRRFKPLMDLAGQGLTFDQNFVSLSLCCPSRSTLLRGQYAHDTGVYGNKAPEGGFLRFHERGHEKSTLATWLSAAGYRTALMGKYLNGFPKPLDGSYVPPGWSHFISALDNGGYGQYDYDLAVDGKVEHHGRAPGDYLTDLLAVRAREFIAASIAAGEPFFLYVAPFSPHSPSTAAPRYVDAFPEVTEAPRPPSFDEADTSDKPSWLRGIPPLPKEEIEFIDRSYRKRLQSMLAVQDLVVGLVKTLKDAGKLDETFLLFTSDNGFHLGEHRLNPGKNTEFDTDLRVPLFITGPGVPAGKSIAAITGNVDLAPTIAELAGAKAPDFVDGRSLAPFLRGGAPPVWRHCYLLEHAGPEQMEKEDESAVEYPDNLEESPDPSDEAQGSKEGAKAVARIKKKGKRHKGKGRDRVPIFVGIRTEQWKFIEYQDGEKELYDLVKDPGELDNIAAKADPALLKRLHDRAAGLAACHGATCRAAEESPP